jgi:hypothetical protein
MRSSTVTCLLSFDRPTNNCPFAITSPPSLLSTVSGKRLRASPGEFHAGPGLVPDRTKSSKGNRGERKLNSLCCAVPCCLGASGRGKVRRLDGRGALRAGRPYWNKNPGGLAAGGGDVRCGFCARACTVFCGDVGDGVGLGMGTGAAVCGGGVDADIF